jgi:hypothetical protein
VKRGGFRAIETEVVIPGGETVRRDFRLADSALTRGTASVVGKAIHADGSAIASGQVYLSELGVDAPIQAGAFSFNSLPAGTWSLEARVLGYEPQTLIIDAVDGAPANITVKVANKVQVLDAVTVYGNASSGNLKVLNGIAERRRVSFGTTFLPGNSWMESAIRITDVLQSARGFRYVSMDSVIPRGCLEAVSIFGIRQRMVLMLDGSRFAGDLAELQHMVPMREVLAVETYPDPQSIPSLWRSNDACGLIAVWTKH